MLQIEIETTNVVEFLCDALVLKYAQSFYGVDAIVAATLTQARHGEIEIDPQPGSYALLPSDGAIAANHVLFVGVVPLYKFDYSAIRTFAARALTVVANELPNALHIAMTIHGAGYGLDEREAFLAQLGGIMDAEKKGISSKRITIVEKNAGRAARLKAILRETWSQTRSVTAVDLEKPGIRPSDITAGEGSRKKPHVFIAMPFAKEMEDVYVFGIQGPVNTAGYLCERVDMATFTGDILDRIMSRIDTATLVIADLTGGNANVYLEVGYAWGRGRSTLLLAKKGDDLKFDVRGQRCIVYENIVDLAKKLSADLSNLEIA